MGAVEHNIRHYGGKIETAAASIGVAAATLHAFAAIEVGEIDAKDDGYPVIRIEVHKFMDHVGSSPYVQMRTHGPDGQALPNRWHRLAQWYKSDPDDDWQIVHSGSQGDEYAAQVVASLQDGDAALRCASYGVGQLMGWHHRMLGYRNVRRMVGAAVAGGVKKQIDQWVRYIERDHEGALLEALQGPDPDWPTAVRYYNGSGQVEKYSKRLVLLRNEAARLLRDGVPNDFDLDTKLQRQAGLQLLGYYTGDLDGSWGDQSRRALTAFQRDAGLNPDGWWGPRTEAAMEDALDIRAAA